MGRPVKNAKRCPKCGSLAKWGRLAFTVDAQGNVVAHSGNYQCSKDPAHNGVAIVMRHPERHP